MDTFLNLSLDQVQNALCEILVKSHSLGGEIVVSCSFQTVVSFKIVLLLETKLSNLEESITRVVLLVEVFGHLFEVQDSILLLRDGVFEAFGKDFAYVKMCFDVGVVGLDDLLEVR